jgi:hypothetical protein
MIGDELTLATIGRDLQSSSVTAGAEGALALSADTATPAGMLATYRDAVADLLAAIGGNTGPDGAVKAAEVIHERVTKSELNDVMSRTPGGPQSIAQTLLREIWNYRPDEHGPLVDLDTWMRVYLQSQVDVAWWGHLDPYLTRADLVSSPDLVSLAALRRRGSLGFRYRRQPRGLAGRALRKAERQVWPHRVPHTAGMRFPYARPEAVDWLNALGVEFQAACGAAAAPGLWVNSMARSLEHQNHLRGLGYLTVLPSAHCVGYAMDLEMTWMRRFNAHTALQHLLFERMATGEVNVIDEGQVWHVCVSPDAAARLRRDAVATTAG